jgi:hypothetical protein
MSNGWNDSPQQNCFPKSVVEIPTFGDENVKGLSDLGVHDLEAFEGYIKIPTFDNGYTYGDYHVLRSQLDESGYSSDSIKK